MFLYTPIKSIAQNVKTQLRLGSTNKGKSNPQAISNLQILREIANISDFGLRFLFGLKEPTDDKAVPILEKPSRYIPKPEIFSKLNWKAFGKFLQKHRNNLNPEILDLLGTITSAVLAEVFECGNCEEQNDFGFMEIIKNHIPFLKRIEKFWAFPVSEEIWFDPHFFSVLNRQKSSNINDPASWGNEVVVFDPWLEKVLLPQNNTGVIKPDKQTDTRRHEALISLDFPLSIGIKEIICDFYQTLKEFFNELNFQIFQSYSMIVVNRDVNNEFSKLHAILNRDYLCWQKKLSEDKSEEAKSDVAALTEYKNSFSQQYQNLCANLIVQVQESIKKHRACLNNPAENSSLHKFLDALENELKQQKDLPKQLAAIVTAHKDKLPNGESMRAEFRDLLNKFRLNHEKLLANRRQKKENSVQVAVASEQEARTRLASGP